jgi:eukaryotic-like serine/threonine-protein kinase
MTTASVDEDALGDTRASPSAPQAPAPLVAGTAGADARHTTILPAVEWSGDQPRLVSSSRSRFEELGELGKGGMGEVFLARDHDIDRTVALKKLPEGCDTGQVLRFVEEVRAVGKLEHPNIVPVHDVGIDERGRFFFVMKHLQGESLETIVKKLQAGDPEAKSRFSRPVQLQILLGVLHAVGYAHRQGFVHRDLKPGNIMVGPFGEVTVIDWGIAKRVMNPDGSPVRTRSGDLPAVGTAEGKDTSREEALKTRQGALVGTALYMSPEQARGDHEKLDFRSDLYSVAVIFHELVTLKHYLTGKKSLKEVVDGVQTVLPAFPSIAPADGAEAAPCELAWFFDKGLAKDPAQRFQTADQMVEHLQTLLDGRFAVQCSRTAMKRGLHAGLHGIDKHPAAWMFGGPVLGVFAVGSMVWALVSLVRWALS